MPETFQITHLDYHPIGSESTALTCNAVGIARSGSPVLVDDEGFVHALSVSEYGRAPQYMFELDSPMRLSSGQTILVIGHGLAQTLLEAFADRPLITELLDLPGSNFQTRVRVAMQSKNEQYAKGLSQALLEAFDREIACGRGDDVFAEKLWELIDRCVSIYPDERTVRGVHFYAERDDQLMLRRLINEAQTLDHISGGQLLAFYLSYQERIKVLHSLQPAQVHHSGRSASSVPAAVLAGEHQPRHSSFREWSAESIIFEQAMRDDSFDILAYSRRSTPGRLSYREAQVLALVARELTNLEISASLQISQSTVKNYVRNIMQKYQVSSRKAAVLAAREAGDIT